MNETEAILIIIAIVVGILIMVGGLGWGISAYARDQRRTRSRRTEEYHPPPLAPRERQGIPGPDEHPGIQWGDVVESNVAEPGIERIRFGNMELAEEYEYVEVNPYSDGPIVKCPVCHRRIGEGEDNTKVCPECQEGCHQHCFELMDNKCPICGHEER
jgi:hypothetical protein